MAWYGYGNIIRLLFICIYVHVGGHHTPGQNSPLLLHRHNYTFAHTRERLYRAGPGKYFAVEDVEPQQQGDIPLKAGMPVAGE